MPRVLRPGFVDWNADREGARAAGAERGGRVVEAIQNGRGHEYVPFAAQSAG